MKSDMEWWETWSVYCARTGDNRKALAQLVEDVRQEYRREIGAPRQCRPDWGADGRGEKNA